MCKGNEERARKTIALTYSCKYLYTMELEDMIENGNKIEESIIVDT